MIRKCTFYSAIKICIVFEEEVSKNNLVMQTRSTSSSTTTVLIVVLLLLTFPLWIGILGGLFGMVAGLIGAAFGVVAGVFGAVFGAIAGAFGWMFDWNGPWNFHFGIWGMKFFMIVAIIVLVIHLSRPRK
jgi:hypothetical protein